MTVEIDERSGFCFGVVNAITLAERSLAEGRRVYSLGDIVHNRPEVERLERLGLHTVTHGELGGLSGERVLIRAHGEPPETYDLAERLGIEILDATCPVVASLQKTVAHAHAEMKKAGGQVVILGKRGHAEVTGLAGQAGGEVTVIEGMDDLGAVDPARPVYLLSQTTQSLTLFGRVSAAIRAAADDPSTVAVNDTICRQVANREPHLREFASRFDAVVFVGGRKSSNGSILFEACRTANPRSHMVEDETELRGEWFAEVGSVGVYSVGVCGATSTPKWTMERVAQRIMSEFAGG